MKSEKLYFIDKAVDLWKKQRLVVLNDQRFDGFELLAEEFKRKFFFKSIFEHCCVQTFFQTLESVFNPSEGQTSSKLSNISIVVFEDGLSESLLLPPGFE